MAGVTSPRVVPVTVDRPPVAQRLDLARFYKRRKVQGHMWGFVAFLCLLVFVRNVYAAGTPDPAAWDQATWLAFFGVVSLGLKTLDTLLKVRRDARRRTGPRPIEWPPPPADDEPDGSPEAVAPAAGDFLPRSEFDEYVKREDQRHKTYRDTLNGIAGEVRELHSEQRDTGARTTARLDELRRLIVDALSARKEK